MPEWYRGEALLAVAARVGTTRLIDNLPVLVGPGRRAARRRSPDVPHARAEVCARDDATRLTLPRRLGRARTRLDDARRRRRGRLRHRRADLRAAAARAGRPRAAGHQDGARRRARPGGRRAASRPRSTRRTHPQEHLRRHPGRRRRAVRRGGGRACWSPRARRGCASSSRSAPSSTATPDGEIALTREGGHHRDRIAHAGGDATGAEISRALIAALRRGAVDDPGIEVVEHALVVDLLQPPTTARVCGVTLHVHRRGPAGRRRRGLRRGRSCWPPAAWGRSTPRRPTRRSRPATASRRRCGPARAVTDLEFVQFHPTVLWLGEGSHRPAAADLRGGARRGRVPGRRRRRAVHARACTSWPTWPRATWWPGRSST